MNRNASYISGNDGLAAVEFALIAPFLIALLIGMMDFGMYINQRMQMENIARAAAEYVVKGGEEANVMTDVIAEAVPATELAAFTFDSGSVCECSSDGAEIDCALTCDEGYQRRFYFFSMSREYTPMFPYPGIPESITLAGDARLQVQ